MDTSNTSDFPVPVPGGPPSTLSAVDDSLFEFSQHPPDEAARVSLLSYLNPRRLVGNIRFSPLICAGDACRYTAHCPLAIRKHPLPIGDACPVEMQRMVTSISERAREMGIQMDHYTDVAELADVAYLEILIDRASQELGNVGTGGMVISDDVGFDRQGNVIRQRKTNPALLAIEKMRMLKTRILKDLEATRKGRRQAGHQERQSQAESLAKARKALADMSSSDKELLGKALDAHQRRQT
jgi:hypothetical protein